MNEATRNPQPADGPNVNPKGADDDPRFAPESGGVDETRGRDKTQQGDPKRSARSERDDALPGRDEQKGNHGRVGEDLESGRRDAT